jgi:spermidine/putrescine-binding protein
MFKPALHRLFLGMLVVSLAAFVCFPLMRNRVVLRIAIVEGQPSRNLRGLLDSGLKPNESGLPKRLEVHIFQRDYEHLYKDLVSGKQQFDVIMLDDPWLAELAKSDLLEPVPPGETERDINKKGGIERFAPQFLRVCYYRAKKASGELPRRPPLGLLAGPDNTVDRAKLKSIREARNYVLYALPFVGNVQVLARHPPENVADPGVDLQAPPHQLRWLTIEKALGADKFFSRLATNNSALADFLPILWSNGGCLIGSEDGKEVSGLDPETAKRAFEQSLHFAQNSPVQYARFNDQDVFDSLLREPQSVGISWLAYRAEAQIKGLQWYRMPDGDTETKPSCLHNEERMSNPGAKHGGGVLGAWLLAVPRGASNQKDAWNFINWALTKSDMLPEAKVPNSSCSASSPVGNAESDYGHGEPTPFEDRLSCGVKDVVSHSTPRPSHHRWHEIEEAVGFRIRQAHWQPNKLDEFAKQATEDLTFLLREKNSNK